MRELFELSTILIFYEKICFRDEVINKKQNNSLCTFFAKYVKVCKADHSLRDLEQKNVRFLEKVHIKLKA